MHPGVACRPRIRAGDVTGNDGGQHHNWKHHNGAASDPADWQRQRESLQAGRMLAFEDRDCYVYMAGDATRAYSPAKLESFTRQIVYLRPDTFVVFDRVKSAKAEFKKAWLLQAMKKPEGTPPNLVLTHGKGRLFIQTLLPENPQVTLASGENLYSYGGQSYPPSRDTGPAPECRIEVSPSRPAQTDCFLHVLTAAEAAAAPPPRAHVRMLGEEAAVTVGEAKLAFRTDRVAGTIEMEGKKTPLAEKIEPK